MTEKKHFFLLPLGLNKHEANWISRHKVKTGGPTQAAIIQMISSCWPGAIWLEPACPVSNPVVIPLINGDKTEDNWTYQLLRVSSGSNHWGTVFWDLTHENSCHKKHYQKLNTEFFFVNKAATWGRRQWASTRWTDHRRCERSSRRMTSLYCLCQTAITPCMFHRHIMDVSSKRQWRETTQLT